MTTAVDELLAKAKKGQIKKVKLSDGQVVPMRALTWRDWEQIAKHQPADMSDACIGVAVSLGIDITEPAGLQKARDLEKLPSNTYLIMVEALGELDPSLEASVVAEGKGSAAKGSPKRSSKSRRGSRSTRKS